MKILWIFLCMAGVAAADLVRLNDGTVLIGDILEETPLEVRIETELAGGTILRTERIARRDIAEIQRWTAEQKRDHRAAREFEKAQRYRLSPQTSLTLAAYQRVIDGVLRKFLADYPDSVHAPAVQAQLQAWETERNRVAAGQVKVDGQWISQQDHQHQQRAEQIRQLTRQAEEAMRQQRWPQAVAACESVLALTTDGPMAEGARRQLAVALREWQRWVEESLAPVRGQLTAAQERVQKARQAHQEAEAQLRNVQARANQQRADGKLGALGGELMRAQQALTGAATQRQAAEETLASLRAQVESAERQLADIRQRVERHQLQAEVAAAAATRAPAATPTASAPAAAPAGGGGSDVVEDTASWWSQNWMWLAGAALLGLWLLTRLTR